MAFSPELAANDTRAFEVAGTPVHLEQHVCICDDGNNDGD
jgi:hypothetical protein